MCNWCSRSTHLRDPAAGDRVLDREFLQTAGPSAQRRPGSGVAHTNDSTGGAASDTATLVSPEREQELLEQARLRRELEEEFWEEAGETAGSEDGIEERPHNLFLQWELTTSCKTISFLLWIILRINFGDHVSMKLE